jgi:phosphomannomutase
MIPASIFKSYDIRGLVASELSSELAYQLGRALVIFFEREGISFEGKLFAVGYDMRETSPGYTAELIRGITDQGVDVVNIGLVSTPLFNITVAREEQYAAGVMVTASHNPAAYNGFKITRGNGLPVGMGSGMETVRDLVLGNSFEEVQRKGSVVISDPLPAYVEQIVSLVDTTQITKKKIVVDYGNGMGSVTLPAILSRLPVEVIPMYDIPDGTFPNHEANPLHTPTLADLQAKVKEVGADFGFALDGDADRIGLVDEHGEIVGPSQVGILVGLEVLRLHGNSGHMLYDLRSSSSVKEVWEAAGATAQMCRVGHAHIKKQVRESGAIFASELSLHLYYGCLLYTSDAAGDMESV